MKTNVNCEKVTQCYTMFTQCFTVKTTQCNSVHYTVQHRVTYFSWMKVVGDL